MSIAATFGSGGGEPYARALRRDEQVLYLRDTASVALTGDRPLTMPIARWRDEADDVDRSLLSGHAGSVLDIGCGPARMVKAARDRGLFALGIDVSGTVVAMARKQGLPVIRRSVFDPLPREGSWDLALLVDGNIGIGGDVTSLLTRCAMLLTPAGTLVVEVDADHARDRQYDGTLTDMHGHQSASFPWAEIGSYALADRAAHAGMTCGQPWAFRERWFCRLARKA